MKQNIFELIFRAIDHETLAQNLGVLVNDATIANRIVNGIPLLDHDKLTAYIKSEYGDDTRLDDVKFRDNCLLSDCIELRFSQVNERWFEEDPGLTGIVEYDDFRRVYNSDNSSSYRKDDKHTYQVRYYSQASVYVVPENFEIDENYG